MTRKSSLSDALQQAAIEKPSEAAPSQHESASPLPSRVPPSRAGKKTIAGHFDPAVSRQLRQLALEEDTSVQELLREALNDLFDKRKRPPLA